MGEEALTVLRPGDFLGEMSFFEQEPRSARAVAHEDAQLLEIGNKELKSPSREASRRGARFPLGFLSDPVPASARDQRQVLFTFRDLTGFLILAFPFAQFRKCFVSVSGVANAVSPTLVGDRRAQVVLMKWVERGNRRYRGI